MQVVCTHTDVIDTTTLRRVVELKQLAVEQAYDVGKKQLIGWLEACLAEREDGTERFDTLLARGDYEISTYETMQLMQALGVKRPDEFESAIHGYRFISDLLPEGLVVKVRYSFPRISNNINWEPSIYLDVAESS